MPHPDALRLARRYLATADRLLPGRIGGFYLVGSAALGAWRPGRSDVDFVAVTEGEFGDPELRRLRLLHPVGNATAVARAVLRARPGVPGTMNGAFVPAAELGRPVTEIRPIASHTGHSFRRGAAFDVNPVMWQVLRERGVALRGPEPAALGLDPEPGRLREWNLGNLRGYWRRWGEWALMYGLPGERAGERAGALAGRRGRGPRLPARLLAGHATVWGTLGPPRLHHTLATGEVISKEAAGEYALGALPGRWHPLIRLALARRRGEPEPAGLGPELADPARRIRHTGAFVLEVIADAERR
ncbi:aminoglycoside adenylyltransferase domain-containing protein [Streptomyces hoynatensis]|uniref:DUF4111 domain-containing protein n=1 Tax=Streptomyces hoynatensis TaxID=1141874 RepID=A0A3A9ZEW9_9ACTN|nr:aminoglycoside adenylyltransferase domain-containing protein [Streptomyces hoynatensis]RKN45836.1 DUF4111 domain-containing protein [Streptomyces hoynatensis]